MLQKLKKKKKKKENGYVLFRGFRGYRGQKTYVNTNTGTTSEAIIVNIRSYQQRSTNVTRG